MAIQKYVSAAERLNYLAKYDQNKYSQTSYKSKAL